MAKSYHNRGFDIGIFLIVGLQSLDDEDRKTIFDGIGIMYCLYCGRKQPDDGACDCGLKDLLTSEQE